MTLAQVAGLFTAPLLAGIGAAAVSVPIVIHLMSRFRRRPEAWGAMRFLIEAYQKQRKRLQLEKLLLLLVRCAVVLLAGLALAGPVLSGCSKQGFSLTGSGGRVVYLVIDDALSSQTREAGQTRLSLAKDRALGVIEEMRPTDRAVIVRMARPVVQALDAPTSDAAALREAVSGIEARFSRGALIDALMLVESSIEREGVDDAVIVLLSDFPASSDYFEQPIPPELEGLGNRATIVSALPAQGTDNLQVMSLQPRRRMVVSASTGATVVGGRVELRRFGAIAQPRRVDLSVRVSTSGGEVLAETTREVRFPAGEREQGTNFDLPVTLSAESTLGRGRELVVRAALLPSADASGVDVLEADDAASAVVRLRDRLQVALIDDEQDLNPNPGELEAWQWVRAALSPRGPGAAGSFEVSPMLPTALNDEAIRPFDAALVLRPDALTLRSWDALVGFARRGGLVWVFAPAIETDAAPDWVQTMGRRFDLPWSFADAMVSSEDALGEARSIGVDETAAPPAELQFLAADWREKLGWWSVRSWLPFSADEADRWVSLKVDETRLVDADRMALLACRSVGRGSLVFCATPLDTRFTNLPIRALFVPLMHDTLCGVLGNTAGQASLISGDRVDLGATWRGVGELRMIEPASGVADDAATGGDGSGVTILVQSEGELAELREAVQRPGVYVGEVSGSPRLLVVNPDSDAGDTYGGQGALELMLDELGGWSYLSDREAAGGVLAQSPTGKDLTGLLLWLLLGLVLLETFLARWFSHATEHDAPTIVGRVIDALHGQGPGQGTTGGSTGTQQAGGRA
ncbi:MAG: BatA domain-containing protein [Phycisphaeraceae bacterium]